MPFINQVERKSPASRHDSRADHMCGMSPLRQVQALEVEKAGLEVQLRAAQHKATETQQRAAELSLERDAALIARENLEQEVCISSVPSHTVTFHLLISSLLSALS